MSIRTAGRLLALLMAPVFAGVTAGSVHAQSSEPASQAPQRPPQAQSGLDEIIVTAQRREQLVRDVPISISSQTAEQLDKASAKNLEDLTYTVPGLVINDTGALITPAIRGISATAVGSGTNQPVGIYLDGVYQPNMYTNKFEFADLARVEVDKGPQGTLYGRNATAGAIAVFTKAPSFEPAGDFALGYGNFNDVLAKGFVTGPLARGVLAGSLSGFFERHDDYAYNIATQSRASGLNSKVFRGKLLFTPTPSTKFTLTVGYQDRYDTESADEVPYHGNTAGAQDPSAIITTRPHYIAQNFPGHLHLQDYNTTLNAEFDLGFGTVTSISSGRYTWLQSSFDDDHTYNPTQSDRFVNGGDAFLITQKEHTYTEDLSFASEKWGGFSFIAGASYFFDNNRFAPGDNYNSFGRTLSISDSLPITSYDGFVEGTYDLTDRLVLAAGVRYTWERTENSGAVALPSGVIQGKLSQTTFSDFTPRASLLYKLTNDTNVYVTYSTGFKSGGIPSTAFISGVPSYLPETVKGYELGVKSNPSPRWALNAAAYYYDYSNIQVQVSNNGTSQFISNAGSARIYGFDADVTARLTDEFTITPALSLLDASYVNYSAAFVLVPRYGLATDPIPGAPAGNMLGVVDASGKRMPRAPTVTFTLTGDYTKTFDAGTLDLNALVYYSSKTYFDSIQRVSQGDYAILNARLSWQPAHTRFRFELWGKNLTDRNYIVSVFEDNTSDAAGYAPPRTFGATAKYSF